MKKLEGALLVIWALIIPLVMIVKIILYDFIPFWIGQTACILWMSCLLVNLIISCVKSIKEKRS